MPRLLAAAAFGLAVEAQRRSLDAAATVVGRFGSPLGILARPGGGGGARVWRWRGHHLDLDGWAARGLAEQRRAQEVAARAIRALIAALVAAVLDEVDLDQVVARVDLDRIVDRINLNQIAARIDLTRSSTASTSTPSPPASTWTPSPHASTWTPSSPGWTSTPSWPGSTCLQLTEQVIDEVDLGEIIRESSSTMASETVDALRVQGMHVDGLVSRIVDRILLREGQRQTGPLPDGPRP